MAEQLNVTLRAGVHTGECELIGNDVGGLALHIGARVAHLAAGELLISPTVKDFVVGSGLEFAERGEHHLKGVPGRWRVFAVADPGVGADPFARRRDPTLAQRTNENVEHSRPGAAANGTARPGVHPARWLRRAPVGTGAPEAQRLRGLMTRAAARLLLRRSASAYDLRPG